MYEKVSYLNSNFYQVPQGVVQAEQPEVITDEVKLIHNDDSVKLHKKIYLLEKHIERLEAQLAKEKEYGTI